MRLAAHAGIGATAILAMASVTGPVACAQVAVVEISAPAVENTGRSVGDAFLVDFTEGFGRDELYISDFDIRSDWSFMYFRRANVMFDDAGMTLHTRKNGDEDMPYTSAEVQRVGFYGYGRYEVVMRASNAPGAVASFFTHTSEYLGDPHDEVDIEVLGRAPHAVHVNHFSGGDSDAAVIELGFDASEAEHLYAFEWLPGSITWYVDGVKVHEVTNATSVVPVPTTSSRVIVNTWVGNRDTEEWLGTPEFEETSALYRCLSHIPAGQTGRQCSDVFTPPPRS
jgi:endo-1,3-1,4-beta-glycanase ExoK